METNKVKFESTGLTDPTKRQVRLQLTHCEFMILYALLADATSRPSPGYDLYEKLLHHILVGLFKKFFFESAEIRAHYIIDISSIECIAFWLYWTDHSYSADTPTGKVLDRMNNFILLLFTPDPYKN